MKTISQVMDTVDNLLDDNEFEFWYWELLEIVSVDQKRSEIYLGCL